jgi:hypothetical protein
MYRTKNGGIADSQACTEIVNGMYMYVCMQSGMYGMCMTKSVCITGL